MRDQFDISGVFETTEFEITQVACMSKVRKIIYPFTPQFYSIEEGFKRVCFSCICSFLFYSDFLLMYLRDMLPERPDLKIILMSATLNAGLFQSYFNGCPVVDIPGKILSFLFILNS